MNNGAFIFQESVFSADEISSISKIARELEKGKTGVHAAGKYADLNWFQVNLSEDLEFCKKILTVLGIQKPELLVFYYLDPGAKLHPHRDLTGAGLNNRIRFHVPIITNQNVTFVVSDEVVKMKPGDLWCLDTSYVHSVENMGKESRVHIIIECDVNEKIRQKIPHGIDAKLHSALYFCILVGQLAKALAVNSIRNPKYFIDQMKMVFRFLKWRIFKIEKPK